MSPRGLSKGRETPEPRRKLRLVLEIRFPKSLDRVFKGNSNFEDELSEGRPSADGADRSREEFL